VESAAALAWIAVAAIALIDRRAMKRLRRTQSAPGASVTMIVPARDEAHNIGAWVRDARRQSHAAQRIIVADDCSTDGTRQAALAAAAGDPRVEVRSFGPPPPGWIGKTWAAHKAASLARSRWLVFSDADVRLDPDALASALHAAKATGADAFSMTATLECDSWWERQIMPAVATLILSAMPACLVNDDRSRVALLAGGFILARREAYELVGGHMSVRGSIAEDRDLAERFKAFGYRIRLFDGSELLRVRMYRGLSQMWTGWRKNFFEGARRRPLIAGAFVAVTVAMLVLPAPVLLGVGVLGAYRGLSAGQRRLASVCAICVAATALVRVVRDRAIGFRTDVSSLAATPLAGAFAAAVMAASAWRVMSGRGQRWKGRTIL
jgi:chlorobactene glucosyltransferase